ncbi:hypothetical protein L7F22_041242 [Adiantum nelumboides]|nr:hypothetical protein [Adiantum nelumboides]
MPDMLDLPGSPQQDKGEQGPAPGALDVRANLTQDLLRTSSYKVTTVDNGNKALEDLGLEGSHGLQINISDYCMPRMTGYDLLKRIKETSALKEILVVIMSSKNVSNLIQRCLDKGAKEFIMQHVHP